MRIELLREQCEKLLRELAEEYHRAGAGLQEGLDTTSILDAHAHLANLDHLEAVDEALDRETEPFARRRLRMLREHLASIHEQYRCRLVTDRIDRAEATASVDLDGRSLPYRAVLGALMNEPSRERRRHLDAARRKVLASFEPLYRERHATVFEVCLALGYDNPVERSEDLGGLPLSDLADELIDFLAATEQPYKTALAELLETHRIPVDDAEWFDLVYLFRASAADDYYPAGELLPRMTAWTGAMGLDIRAGGNVQFDLEERPQKSPRPFCSIIEVPRRIVMVLRPLGGQSDYAAFLHELGHALHYGNTDPALPWEFRHLGDNSVTEGYAFLFDRLIINPGWQRDVNGVPPDERLISILALRELMMNRRYAAQVLYELELMTTDKPEAMQWTWVSLLEDATGVHQPPENYLASVDPEFYSARYWRGWLFEAAIQRSLTEDYGARWYCQPDAGRRLTELWRDGQSWTVEEVAEQLGTGLTSQALADRFEALLH